MTNGEKPPSANPLVLLIVVIIGGLALAAMCLGTAIVIFT